MLKGGKELVAHLTIQSMKKYNGLFVLMATLLIAGCLNNQTSNTHQGSFNSSEESASETVDYSALAYSTHEEYMDAENDTLLKVKGVVTAITANQESAFLQDGTFGYHVYDKAAVPNLEVGKTYTIAGNKGFYNGAHEIKNLVYVNEEGTACTYTVNDLSATNFSSSDEMKPYHGSCIALHGVVIKNIPSLDTEKGFNILLSLDDHTITLRVDPANLSADDFTAAKALFQTCAVGQGIDVEGIMSAFGYRNPYSPQIILLDVSSIKTASLEDDVLVDNALSTIVLPYAIESGKTSLDLPTSVEGSEVSIAWSSSNPEIISNTGNITQPENDTIVTLTASGTLNASSRKTSYFVNVIGSVSKATLAYTETFTHANSDKTGNYGQSGIKQGYADGVAEFVPGYRWMFNSALHGSSSADHHYLSADDESETWCARIKPTSAAENAGIYTFFSFENLAYVDFYLAGYGTYTDSICTVSYSLDGGETWIATDVTYKTTNTLSYVRAYLNQTEACQVKFSFENENKSATSNLDYIQFYTSSK